MREFINFAFKYGSCDGKVLCPCTECVNNLWVDEDTTREHLLWHGFLECYTLWNHHGEKRSSFASVVGNNANEMSSPHCDMHDMLHDIHEMCEGLDANIKEPNEDIPNFYRLLTAAQKELYP